MIVRTLILIFLTLLMSCDRPRRNPSFDNTVTSVEEITPQSFSSSVDGSNFRISLTPTFRWTSSTGASSYTLELSRLSDFSKVFYKIENISDQTLEHTLPRTNKLKRLTRYYWRVTAINGSNSIVATNSSSSFDTRDADISDDSIGDIIFPSSGLGALYSYFGISGSLNYLSTDTSGASLTITGSGTFARDYEIGDVNGDGIDDLIVGSGSVSNGRVYIFYGGSSLKGNLTTANANVVITGESNDHLGRDISVGDINHDGIDDIIMTVFRANTEGSLYIIFGRDNFNLTISDIVNDADIRIDGHQTGSFLYSYVDSADVNGDGINDILWGYDNELYVFYGKSSWNKVIDSANETDWNVSGFDKAESIATGDLDNDGIDDIAIGSSTADLNGTNSGGVYVFKGSETLSSTSSVLNDAAKKIFFDEGSNRFYGVQLEMGDISGDGIADLAVGATGGTTSGLFSNVGSVTIEKGSESFFSVKSATRGLTDGFVFGQTTGDQMGSGVIQIGQFTGLSFRKLVVASPQFHSNDKGRVYVFYGGLIQESRPDDIFSSVAFYITGGSFHELGK